MKLFVTGGAGFIGSAFIRYWLKEHPEDLIVNFDKLTYAGNLENLASIEKSPHYSFVKGDICDAQAVSKAMDGCDVIVHYAAESHVDRSINDAAPFIQTNIVGTDVLLEQALQYSIKRFHHISTDEVFGSLALDGGTFDENSPYNPRSPYAASKAAADHLVRAYYHTYGLPITISNCSNNYGPYHFPEKMIPLMILNAMNNKPLPLYGDGLHVRDWIHVLDHARAVDLIVQQGKIGETYCVSGHAERHNIDVVKEILKQLQKPESLIQPVKDRPGHDRRYALDGSKIEHELGFAPRYTFEKGLTETIQWYKDNQSWWERVLNHQYEQYYVKQYAQ